MKKPILVTGSHRSGSTWIGKVISTSDEVGYVREPFNLGMRWYNHPFSHQLEYISNACPPEHQEKTLQYMRSFIGFPGGMAWARLFHCRSLAELYFAFRDLTAFRRRFRQRVLFKDPVAIFSSEWIYRMFDCDVVIIIRHPAAFVASLKVKNWTYDFNNLWDQKELMKSYLSDYADEIRRHVEEPQDIISQGILFWNIYYDTILTFQEKYKDEWIFIKHEDFSLHPMESFTQLFQDLHLEMTDKVKQMIQSSTTAENESVHMRNAAENVHSWKERLTKDEIERIKSGTWKIWKHYYDENDWD